MGCGPLLALLGKAFMLSPRCLDSRSLLSPDYFRVIPCCTNSKQRQGFVTRDWLILPTTIASTTSSHQNVRDFSVCNCVITIDSTRAPHNIATRSTRHELRLPRCRTSHAQQSVLVRVCSWPPSCHCSSSHVFLLPLMTLECLISGIPFALHIKNMRIFTIVPTATSAHYGTLHPCLVTTT
ncbi:hypothetical protein GWK47_029913 [Chionoecetes opilio]|uniref:Uncharacterized protein n=1 Tax=Chionoecetes opilio TaxID=41210 RepID=A0A8J4YS46_CHIOP|nr:hypothetical protein GWK47_029913 [Chionoecetes opilio]